VARVRRRLSDTAVLAGMAPSGGGQMSENASVNVSVRRIDNGYIVCESRCGPGQAYETRERFSREKPALPRFGSVFEPDVGRN
jgi:hypothetical protein